MIGQLNCKGRQKKRSLNPEPPKKIIAFEAWSAPNHPKRPFNLFVVHRIPSLTPQNDASSRIVSLPAKLAVTPRHLSLGTVAGPLVQLAIVSNVPLIVGRVRGE